MVVMSYTHCVLKLAFYFIFLRQNQYHDCASVSNHEPSPVVYLLHHEDVMGIWPTLGPNKGTW